MIWFGMEVASNMFGYINRYSEMLSASCLNVVVRFGDGMFGVSEMGGDGCLRSGFGVASDCLEQRTIL